MADQIAISTQIKINALNTPLDSRTRVFSSDSIQDILNPYVGMHIWISDLAKLVVVTSVEPNKSPFKKYDIKTTLLNVFDAPNDGKFYCRWNNQWIDITQQLKRPNYIRVAIYGTADGRWYLNSNSHSYASNLLAIAGKRGIYKIKFKLIQGFLTPLSTSINVILSWDNQIYSCSATYISIKNTGYIKVSIDGPETARWTIDNINWYRSSDSVLYLAGDNYTVYFSSDSAYYTPLNITNVQVLRNLTTYLTAQYTPKTQQQYVYYGLADSYDYSRDVFDVDKMMTNLHLLWCLQNGLLQRMPLLQAIVKDVPDTIIITNVNPSVLPKDIACCTILTPEGYNAKFYSAFDKNHRPFSSDDTDSVVNGLKTRILRGITYRLYTASTYTNNPLPYKVFANLLRIS